MLDEQKRNIADFDEVMRWPLQPIKLNITGEEDWVKKLFPSGPKPIIMPLIDSKTIVPITLENTEEHRFEFSMPYDTNHLK